MFLSEWVALKVLEAPAHETAAPVARKDNESVNWGPLSWDWRRKN